MICETLAIACLSQYLPPAKYDFEPPAATFRTITLPEKQLFELCGMEVWACTMIRPEFSVILIHESVIGEARTIVLRHEKAHVNGWALTHDHNKGRVVYHAKSKN